MRICSICGNESQEAVIHCENGINICISCALKMNAIVTRKAKENKVVKKLVNDFNKTQTNMDLEGLPKLPLPKELKEYLDQYVIGQERAKKTLSVAVYNHYKRLRKPSIDKSNILMIGPTGTGKTLLAKTIARKVKVPFVIVDATSLTQAGYIGEDVEGILVKLLMAANGNIELAQKGIVFLDEFDKIGMYAKTQDNGQSALGKGVQYSLLKLMEGNTVTLQIADTDNPMQKKTVPFNTSNVLFICGGAFAEAKTTEKGTSIGFMTNSSAEVVSNDELDLKELGIIPELMGRLPITVHLQELEKKDLIRILKEPKNSIINQYQQLLLLDQVHLHITEDGMNEIANIAISKKTGARGLRSIIESFMEDIMYEAPSIENDTTCIVNGAVVRGDDAPIYQRKRKLSANTNSVNSIQL